MLESLAGVGGMSSVYRARDRDGAVVAVKLTPAGRPHLEQRFVREARLLRELAHDGIVRYIDSGVDRGWLYLVTEWLEGKGLDSVLRRDKLSFGESLTLIERVAAALGHAHAHGIVHRDVKPSNLFLLDGAVDRAKLIDFGIAHWSDATRVLTRPGSPFGTPGYMAPEQVRGDPELDQRADVFSLGCVLYECLTGRPAFTGREPLAVFCKILHDEAPRAGDVAPGVPPAIEALLAGMMAKPAKHRFPDGAAVAARISAIRVELSGSDLGRRARARTRQDTLTNLEQRLVSVLVAAVDSAPPGVPAVAFDIPSGPNQPKSNLDDTHLDLAEVLPSPDVNAVTVPDEPPPMPDSETSAGVPESVPEPIRAVGSGPVPSGLRARLESAGAHLSVLPNGALIAVLDNREALAQRTAVDQAIDAARCALALRRAWPEARVALATGAAVERQRALVGDVIERAVELLAPGEPLPLPSGNARSASADDIRIDAVTASLVGAQFEISRAAPNDLRLRAMYPTTAPTEVLGKAMPFVGRIAERAALTAAVEACVDQAQAQAVLVTGPAGYGKTRLCEEFVRRLSRELGVAVWYARGDSMYAGVPMYMMAAAMRRMTGVDDGAPVPVRRRALEEWLGGLVPEAEFGRVAAFLGELLELHDDHSAALEPQLVAARADAKLMGAQVRRACVDVLEAQVRQRPLLMVIDNLQWGDQASLEVLDLALRNLAEHPFMVLALGRPEVEDLFPRLWARHDVTEIRLGRLPRRAATRLAQAALGSSLDPDQVDALVQQADGNPFYLEELVRSVASGATSLPDTVRAMVQARLGTLAPGARRILRAASVFGTSFWRGGVVALTGHDEDVDAWLQSLVTRELIAPVHDPGFPGERGYEFRHSLIRDTAYGMLTDDDRRLGHRLAAQWLERAGEDRALVLAEHHDLGGARGTAIPYYLRAAEDALRRSDFDGALAIAERGVGCGAEGVALGAFHRVQMETQMWRGDAAEAARLGVAAMRLLTPGERPWYDVAGEIAAAWAQLGAVDKIDRLAGALLGDRNGDSAGRVIAAAKVAQRLYEAGRHERAEALHAYAEGDAGPTPEAVVSAHLHWCRALEARHVKRDPAAELDEREACVAALAQVGDLRRMLHHQVEIGRVRAELGQPDQAEDELQRALDSAERMGLASAARAAREALAACRAE
ncbi:serine/threonine-protein kinase PknK [Haliangium sp.]|uniref:serine/threonine-protein kinase n=1 Tax=Haliangium sp. TaxID=2663208 RepID=UPI003D139F1F